jgi:hypothetical protein
MPAHDHRDIGGDGEFVRPLNRNRFYRNTPSRGSLMPGTFVFRPVMDSPGNGQHAWHPVKRRPFWQVAPGACGAWRSTASAARSAARRYRWRPRLVAPASRPD